MPDNINTDFFFLDISLNVNQSLSERHQLTFNLFKAQRADLIYNKATMIKKSRAHLAMQKLQQVKCTRSKWKLYRKYPSPPSLGKICTPMKNMHPYFAMTFRQIQTSRITNGVNNGSKGHKNVIFCLFSCQGSSIPIWD